VRLVAEGGPKGPVRTGPVSLESGSFLGTLGAGSLGIVLETELAGTLVIGILEPRVEQTAYGMLSDLVAIHQGRRILPAPYPTAP
jgi:homoserine dehydrogenase